MTSQRPRNIDLDSSSDSDIQIIDKSGVPKTSINLSDDDEADEDEVVSPRKNLHSVVLSDDDEEHLVRLGLREQAHEERLEGLVNLGVAERRRPVPDRMHTVAKVIDGRRVFSVEPVAAAPASDDSDDAERGTMEKDAENETAVREKASGKTDSTRSRKKDSRGSSSDTSEENDKDFIVSDSATPSYHESAGASDELDEDGASDGAAASGDAKADGSRDKRGQCLCQCQCPACRRCEFKCRRRWLQRKQKKGKPTDMESSQSSSDGCSAGKKRCSKGRRLSISDGDDEDSAANNKEEAEAASSSMCTSLKRKRSS